MSTAATYYDEDNYCDGPTVSSKERTWPAHSEFGSSTAQVVRFLRPEGNSAASHSKCSISIEGTSPGWLHDAANQLISILDLAENWDSYGARRVSVRSVQAATELLDSVIDGETPQPSIVPTPEGGVQLEWHIFNIDLEAEITSAGDYSISFEDGTGRLEPYSDESFHRPASDHELLYRFVRQMAARAS